MKHRQWITRSLSVMLALSLAALPGCQSVEESNPAYITEAEIGKEMAAEILERAGGSVDQMKQVAENRNYILYADMDTADFCIKVKSSGKLFYGNPPEWANDDGASRDIQNQMRSQLIIEYYNAANDLKSMNSYKDSLTNGQTNVETCDNGIRVTYQLGVGSSRTLFPVGIRKDALDELMAKMEPADAKTVKSRYRLVDPESATEKSLAEAKEDFPNFEQYGAIYILRPNLGVKQTKALEEIFKAVGYTYEDESKENELLGYEYEDNGNDSFIIPVEYRLEEDGFVATILAKEIKYTIGSSLTKVHLLPFFGSGTEKEGFSLVPDGSGSIIDFADDHHGSYEYNQRLYGEDIALSQDDKLQYVSQSYLPVFGVSTASGGYFSVVESGAASGEVTCALAGGDTAFNQVYATFRAKEQDYVDFQSLLQKDGLYMFPKDVVQQDFTVRYYLFDQETSYIQMAALYRKYLQDRGDLTTAKTTGETPFYLEFLGAIDKRETVFGVPVDAQVPLTTFDQAEEIMNRLLDEGVGNIRLRYRGWANGGMSNTPFDKVSVIGKLGGTKGFRELAAYCEEKGIPFYPDGELTYVGNYGTFSGFNPRKEASRDITGKLSSRENIDLSTGEISYSTSWGRYVVSPRKQTAYLDGFFKGIEKLGLKTLSLGSMGNTLASDFNKKDPLDRSSAMQLVAGKLEEIAKDKVDILFDGCNAGYLRYASGLVNMPMDSSRLSLESYAVPFYQMVVHGYLPFSGEPINMAQDYNRNFLKCAETGAALYYQWMYSPSDEIYGTKYTAYYAAGYEIWFDSAVALYNEYNTRMGDLVNQEITGHRRLQEEVYETTFESGDRVLVNYTQQSITADGIKIPAEGYTVVTKGGAVR